MVTTTVNDVLTLARAQIGVKESPAGSNNVKYNTEYYGKEVRDNASTKYPWCCTFIWWLFKKSNASALFYGGNKTASCTTLMDYGKKNGLFVSSGFKPGDLIFFNWHNSKTSADHIGICTSVTEKAVTCIEGNTSVTNNDNGGNVMQRTRNLSVVVGAYRPKYYTGAKVSLSKGTAKADTVTLTVPVLKQGMKNDTVKALQSILNGRGYNCGAVDGSFGPATLSAVKLFQKNKGLTIDGSVGPATWSKLMG